MTDTNTTDHKMERSNDSDKILNSEHPRKVVLAGPGTGKTYLFKEAIRKKKEQGGQNFLAITFIGNLSDELADELAGLADTTTLHGFARGLVLENHSAEWEYYPRMGDVIREDLKSQGIAKREVGDADYEERTKYYKAIGDDDVVHYAVQLCKEDETKIPIYDLILVDEFQDFNETEAEFIDVITTKNEVLIVGDDDQALYEFKGSFSKFIRYKFDASNDQFESHTLKYCSRCTEVIIDAFHSIVKHFRDRKKLSDRIKKEYQFYPPDKDGDSKLNPKILLFEDVPPGAIPSKIRYELPKILRNQKIKSVLVLGEARTCKSQLFSIARKLREFGFRDVKHFSQHHNIFTFKNRSIFGYRLLTKGANDILGWRLLVDDLGNESQKKTIISKYYNDATGFITAIPNDFKKTVEKNRKTLYRILNKPESDRSKIAESSISRLAEGIIEDEKERSNIFINQLIDQCNYLVRPLANLSVTVCNILGAKGLSADVVFLIGFDQGKLPMKKDVDDSEIYQLLVALTRARKRIYLLNTMGRPVSQFIDSIDKDCLQKV